MSRQSWAEWTEERKYRVWSEYYSTVVEVLGEDLVLSYPAWCDLMDVSMP